MEGIALNEDLMQDDGIHPNAEAQSILLDNAWPLVRQALANHAMHQTGNEAKSALTRE